MGWKEEGAWGGGNTLLRPVAVGSVQISFIERLWHAVLLQEVIKGE